MIAAPLILGALVGLPGPAAPARTGRATCSDEGLAAFNAGDFERAAEAFEAAEGRAACGDDAVLAFNLGRAYEKLAEQDGSPAWACRASQAYGRLRELRAPPALAALAAKAEEAARSACERPLAAPAPAAERPRAELASPAPDGAPGDGRRAGADLPSETVDQTRPLAARTPAGAERPRPWRLGATLGEGLLVHRGEAWRTGVNLEALAGYFAGAVGVEFGAVVGVEAPHLVLARAGGALSAGGWRVRAALQQAATPVTATGGLLGAGVDLELTDRWRLLAGVEASLWFPAPSVVPLEARAGLAHVF